MSVKAKATPTDPALRETWRELWAAIKKARKTLAAAGVGMTVDIRITQKSNWRPR